MQRDFKSQRSHCACKEKKKCPSIWCEKVYFQKNIQHSKAVVMNKSLEKVLSLISFSSIPWKIQAIFFL